MGLLVNTLMSSVNSSGMVGGGKGAPQWSLLLVVLALMIVNAWIAQYSYNAFLPYLESAFQRSLPQMSYWNALWLTIFAGSLI